MHELLMKYVHIDFAARTPCRSDKTSRRAAYREFSCVNNLAIQPVHVKHYAPVIDAESAFEQTQRAS
jgi:hypothetical protein